MSISVLVRPIRSARLLAPAEAHERSVRHRVAAIWGLLVVNVLPYSKGGSVVPLPSIVGKGITQGSLALALILALTVNPRLVVRRNLFLCLVTVLVTETIITAIDAQFLRGTSYRTFRFAEFVIVLWLLSPFWGRRDLMLVRYHLKSMLIVLATAALGYFVGHGQAMAGGRLADVIWPAPPTQVAHYAAVAIGIVVVLWMARMRSGRNAFLTCAAAAVILLLTHTRTALVALIAGLLIAGLSMIVAQARVRKAFTAAAAIATLTILTLSRIITTYLARGENSSQLTSLTGRTKFWGPLLAFPRTKFQEIFGFGLSNASFNGLPIDSNWLASYQEQGLFGIVMCAMILLALMITAYFRPPGVQRALALFLVTYCLLASFTEVGFTDASAYLLDMTVAASLLVPSFAAAKSQPEPRD